MTPNCNIAILATLDTKGAEVAAMQGLLRTLGCTATVIDIGPLGPPAVRADHSNEEVARLAATGRYTLIVLAPGCHDTIDQAFGSVTSSVIRSTATPVLLAPPGCDTTFYARGKT